MPGKFILKKTPKGFFRFSLAATNAMTILTSKNYSSRATCIAGIETIKKNSGSEIEDQTLQKTEEKKCPKCKSLNILTLTKQEIILHCKVYDQATDGYHGELREVSNYEDDSY